LHKNKPIPGSKIFFSFFKKTGYGVKYLQSQNKPKIKVYTTLLVNAISISQKVFEMCIQKVFAPRKRLGHGSIGLRQAQFFLYFTYIVLLCVPVFEPKTIFGRLPSQKPLTDNG